MLILTSKPCRRLSKSFLTFQSATDGSVLNILSLETIYWSLGTHAILDNPFGLDNNFGPTESGSFDDSSARLTILNLLEMDTLHRGRALLDLDLLLLRFTVDPVP